MPFHDLALAFIRLYLKAERKRILAWRSVMGSIVARDGARKFYGRGPVKKKIWFFRIFLLKIFYFCYFLNRKLPINKKKKKKSEHLKVWAINKNKNLMGIAQKIKNRAKKIYWIWKKKKKNLLLFFSPYFGGGGGGMAHPGPPLPPSLIVVV
jgi:hypothetical protein